eukprot:CAMPEP_0197668584 /NCGR_PEP_ID=MMETSP1338-20131121/69741_1 /TAXON_ID=43686 ORGANISM="Pelagodinium beii, Strain RCC1491" /NCGR_SAMPLE_ID=MMETSP1338 /ASSEMBLY_ACC=CAM_ASM_000754 /LENGTH=336 /DNA_ID=CAMNT_0043248011 /DNA_START=38 /DNA_END=1044 /DNA_ORIENTATION=-
MSRREIRRHCQRRRWISVSLAAGAALLTHSQSCRSFTTASWSSRSRLPSRGAGEVFGQRDVQRKALEAEGLASFASFSVLTGAPIPLLMGALFRRAEVVAATPAPVVEVTKEEGFDFSKLWSFSVEQTPPPPTELERSDLAEPRDLMWAFPSFAVFLEQPEQTAPQGLPTWARWLCLATFWPGVVWYLYYKLLVEDDLRRYRGLGIGGSLVILPFALGLFAGVFGEFAYGSLEGGLLDNPFSISFYTAFAWIYLNQWFLYNKVNQLFEEEGRPAPLDPLGLFVPGWNFVTGIRQIHFLAEYWAIQRGEELPRDAFAELFPFARKPTLTLLELATTP